jgi:8-oxo-dGTP diphosphatase
LNEDDQIALVQKDKRFFLPGGGKEPLESDIECLQREFREELGWEIEVGEYITENETLIQNKKGFPAYQLYSRFFWIAKVKQKFTPTEIDHILAWISPQKAVHLLFPPGQAAVIKEIRKKERFS